MKGLGRVLSSTATATVRAGLFPAVRNAAATFRLIVVVSDRPFAVALVAAPHHRHGFGFDRVLRTHRSDFAAELASVGQTKP